MAFCFKIDLQYIVRKQCCTDLRKTLATLILKADNLRKDKTFFKLNIFLTQLEGLSDLIHCTGRIKMKILKIKLIIDVLLFYLVC